MAGAASIVVFSNLVRLRIVSVSPVDGSDDVAITVPIRFTFSQLMDVSSVEAHLGIEPQTAGELLWDGNDAVFVPAVALTPDTLYSVTLTPGAASLRGRLLQSTYSWSFHTRSLGLVYLAWSSPGAGHRNLFVSSLDGSEALRLTDHAEGVWDYAVHPQGEAIVYSVLRQDGGSDLWRTDPDGKNREVLLACPGAACLKPAWSADGRLLAYERRDIWADAPNLDPKAGRIWLFDLVAGRAQPLLDYDVPLHSVVWSPRGERLVVVSPLLPGIEVHDLVSGEMHQFGNEWGAAPTWSPDGRMLVMPELLLAGESLVVELVRVDVETEEVLAISGVAGNDILFVKDESPAWSPGGGWIAFGRQFLTDDRWTPGRQIWLARPDGSGAFPLLSEPMSDHFAMAWRPDGAALAYVRADLSEGIKPVPDVSIWVFDLVQREASLVASEGVSPQWLP
jgi:Tol biopolymer transport system component